MPVWYWNKTNRSVERNRKPRNRFTQISPTVVFFFFFFGTMQWNPGEVFSTNDVKTMGHSHTQK